MKIIPVSKVEQIDLEALVAHRLNCEAGDGRPFKRLFAIPLGTVTVCARTETLDDLLKAQCTEISVGRAQMYAIEKNDIRAASEKGHLRNLRRTRRAILCKKLEQSYAARQPPRSNNLPSAEEGAASRENEIIPFSRPNG
jgi:hypothetical protein